MAKRSPTKFPYNKPKSEQSLQVRQEVMWSAHLPPPGILDQYNKIIPSFSEDLHKEVFQESKHRRSCDSWLIKGGTVRAIFGQVCALTITLAALYVALQLGLAGHTYTAAIIVAINLAGLVGAFLGREIITKQPTPTEDNLERRPELNSREAERHEEGPAA